MPMPRRTDLDQLAFDLHSEGQSLSQIAERLGVTPEMVRRRIRRYVRLQQENGERASGRLNKGAVQ